MPAYIYIQRKAKLVLVSNDESAVAQRGMGVIPSGCASPFVYTFDVANEGPSCVSNLDLKIEIARPAGVSLTCSTVDCRFKDAVDILPGSLSSVTPVTVSIDANATTANWAGVGRTAIVVAPLDTDFTSATTLFAINGTTNAFPIFQQFYDVQRFHDVRVTLKPIVVPNNGTTN